MKAYTERDLEFKQLSKRTANISSRNLLQKAKSFTTTPSNFDSTAIIDPQCESPKSITNTPKLSFRDKPLISPRDYISFPSYRTPKNRLIKLNLRTDDCRDGSIKDKLWKFSLLGSERSSRTKKMFVNV